MTHELKKIIQAYQTTHEKGLKAVLATIVALNGSSYRRPGVRMLIAEDNTMVGAVSGGCVEKEIIRQAATVFKTQVPKIMTYDGRYRLGCEGILYILIEPFTPHELLLKAFEASVSTRNDFRIVSHFLKKDGSDSDYGSVFHFKDITVPLQHQQTSENKELDAFAQEMKPCYKLMLIGAEHDAVQLCSYASLSGWEVSIVATPVEEKDISFFPGAKDFIASAPEDFNASTIDEQTAVVLMTHSYVKDLKYLISLKNISPSYLGLLGPAKRRGKLLDDFLEHCPEVSDAFFDNIHGPAGLDIGAETPQEIAISIMSEILSVLRTREPMKLKNKQGTIHS
ncbi:MAG: XshC-Cox1-family protein [Flavobacteriaceae bacterium]|nr:MAG: XshC-Cox1-family protein [Flavobacteriaceae bacterium]